MRHLREMGYVNGLGVSKGKDRVGAGEFGAGEETGRETVVIESFAEFSGIVGRGAGRAAHRAPAVSRRLEIDQAWVRFAKDIPAKTEALEHFGRAEIFDEDVSRFDESQGEA